MSSATLLTIVDNVKVAVPDTLNLITPYVLLEQQDWFEDEIKFLRRLLQPGQKVIDIGANHGVYTLSMARTVGPTGRIWAFEPASATAAYLAQGISANGYTHVVLERSALSSARGTAQLSLNENSELNALVHDAARGGAVETVPLVTLDDCLEKYEWQDIDFMKMDAEGEESSILRGGRKFFAEQSPLVQFEIKDGNSWHLDLVRDFADLGYQSYRLVPGLDLLAPFDPDAQVDGYLLNLFCCKPDRAGKLAAQGFLLDAAARAEASTPGKLGSIKGKAGRGSEYDWRHKLAALPYGGMLAAMWEQAGTEEGDAESALACHAFSRDASQPPAERHAALEASLGMFTALCEKHPDSIHLASLARVASDYGARMQAVNALSKLVNVIVGNGYVDLGKPFLAPGRRFDLLAPGAAVGNWVLAAALEESERLGAFSSYYTGTSALKRLEYMQTLGFASEEMGRRLQLLQRRFGKPAH